MLYLGGSGGTQFHMLGRYIWNEMFEKWCMNVWDHLHNILAEQFVTHIGLFNQAAS